MNIAEAISISLQSIRANKLRSFLTLLGLIIGVMTLILVMTIVQGANKYVEEKVANLGTNVFQVSKTPILLTDIEEFIRAQRNKDLLLEDLEAVQALCHECMAVGTQLQSTATVKYENEAVTDVAIRGVTSNMAEIGTITIEFGRYLSTFEEKSGRASCVLGRDVVDQLFGQPNVLNKIIRIDAQEYQVVGISDRIGNVLGQSQDNFILIPLNAFMKQFGSRRSLTLQVKAFDSLRINAAQDQVRTILRGRRHDDYNHPDSFYITTSATFLSLWSSISSAFFMVFIMISSIASIVGGIVIMNIMLVTVTERTKEIGIRRAVGATRRDILFQFLLEALVQCLVGGALGIAAGFTLALAVRQFTPFPASVQPWVAFTGFLLSTLIGIFFGLYPAKKAAMLDPIEALHRE
ncbi:MAG: ABC transporter permease [Terriglobia bacterium]